MFEEKGNATNLAFLRRELQRTAFLLAREKHEKEATQKHMQVYQSKLKQKVAELKEKELQMRQSFTLAMSKMYDIDDEAYY